MTTVSTLPLESTSVNPPPAPRLDHFTAFSLMEVNHRLVLQFAAPEETFVTIYPHDLKSWEQLRRVGFNIIDAQEMPVRFTFPLAANEPVKSDYIIEWETWVNPFGDTRDRIISIKPISAWWDEALAIVKDAPDVTNPYKFVASLVKGPSSWILDDEQTAANLDILRATMAPMPLPPEPPAAAPVMRGRDITFAHDMLSYCVSGAGYPGVEFFTSGVSAHRIVADGTQSWQAARAAGFSFNDQTRRIEFRGVTIEPHKGYRLNVVLHTYGGKPYPFVTAIDVTGEMTLIEHKKKEADMPKKNTTPVDDEPPVDVSASEADAKLADDEAEWHGHTLVLKSLSFAVPAHFKKTHGLDDTTVGAAIFAALGMYLDTAITKLGPVKIWEKIEAYDAKMELDKSFPRDGKPAEQVDPEALRDEIADLYKANFSTVTKQDFARATGYQSLADALSSGLKPDEIRAKVAADIQAQIEKRNTRANNAPVSVGDDKSQPTTTTPPATVGAIGKDDNPVSESKAAHKPDLPVPHSSLTEVKTLMGWPVGQIGKVLNRKHADAAYKRIKAKNNEEFWTDLDPIAVRRRLDKVFGPQGYGWRLIPLPGVGKVTMTEVIQNTQKGQRTLFAASLEGFALEYALVGDDGKVFYVQSSAMSDTDQNDDRGYAYRGALTSLMKQALRLFGGFDHFMAKFDEIAA